MPTVISPTTKSFTASLKVKVAGNGPVLSIGTSVIVTVGAVLSTTYVLSFVPGGVVFASALFAMSWMSWPLAKDRVTVASRSARSPPLAITS